MSEGTGKLNDAFSMEDGRKKALFFFISIPLWLFLKIRWKCEELSVEDWRFIDRMARSPNKEKNMLETSVAKKHEAGTGALLLGGG